MNPIKLNRRIFSAGIAACAWPALGHAQAPDWPSRPVRVIAPAPPGGSLDRLSRLLAEGFSKTLRQPFVVENRPGAGSTIGTASVAAAPADGYTLLMSGVFNAISPALYARLPYDYLQDFVHVAPTTHGSNVLVAHPDFPAGTLAELVAAAKAQPGRLGFASAGNGTSGHLTMEIFQRAAGVQLMHVPYKGGSPAMQDVLAGVTPLMATNQDAVLPLVRAGKLKALAITSARRIPAFAQVPTFTEIGYPEMVISSWGVLAARRGTPAAIVERLRETAHQILRQPHVQQPLEAEGWELFDMSPAQFDDFARRETERWAQIIRAAGIRIG